MSILKSVSVLGAIGGLCLLVGAQPSSSTKAPCVWLSSDLIGMKVVSQSGEKLGKIEDVVVHPGGEVAYAVLSFGGTLGIGDKLFAMPWSVLEAVEPESTKKDADRMVVLPIDKERLKAAPGFDKSHWPIMADPDWAKDVDAYYAKDVKAGKRLTEAGAPRGSVITWKATDLKGFDVRTPTGDKLGDIKDVAVDTDGRVSYVVVSVGGFLGVGDRLVAVPWDALKLSLEGDKGDKKKITLAATKEQLEKAPQFKADKEAAREMCNPEWIARVYEYYSVKPYWARIEDKVKGG